MQQVASFPITYVGAGIIEMPRGARLLSLAVTMDMQTGADTTMLYALVDISAPVVRRGVFVLPSNGSVDDAIDGFPYVGTFVLHRGLSVLHVFDGGERPESKENDNE